MKWLLVAVVPIAFAAGFVLGRKTAPPPPAEVALPASQIAAPSIAPPTVPAVAVVDPANDNADVLAQEAQDAFVHRQYKLSIQLTTRALGRNPKDMQAVRILGAARCKVRDRDGALKAYRMADPQFRTYIRFVCHTEGIELP